MFWLQGKSPETKNLQALLESHAAYDLIIGITGPSAPAWNDALDDLTPDLSGIGKETPPRTRIEGFRFQRDERVRSRVRARAKGRCEYCDQRGFVMANGKLYLETHHVLALAKQGPDNLSNVIALCADDHRRAHFAKNRDDIERRMRSILARKIRASR